MFGYVTDRAEIILEKNMLPAIILFGSIAVAGVTLATIITILAVKRKRKYKRLSNNLTTFEAGSGSANDDAIEDLQDINIGNGEEIVGVDELVKQTNDEADAKLLAEMSKGSTPPPPSQSVANKVVPTRPARPNPPPARPNAPAGMGNAPARPNVAPPKPNVPASTGGVNVAPQKPNAGVPPTPPPRPKV